MSGLNGKIVFITGASSGIGEATAKHFASLNCKLVLIARNEDRLKAVAEACKEAGAEDVFMSLHDLGKSEECIKALDEAFKHFGGLDVIVNNAGVMCGANFYNMTEQDFDLSMNVNVKSAAIITQHAVQYLVKSDIKSIVNVSSIAGLGAYKGALAYKLSKAAMDQLTRCSSIEVIEKGIRVNSVNPGVIETPLFDTSGVKNVKGFYDRCKKTHPIGRIGRGDEVAKAIAFLASPDASFIVGQTLAVDGGRSIQIPS